TSTAGVLGPAEHPGLKERAIDDQLPAALEQVEQADLALSALERVLLFHQRPWHSSTLRGERITRAGESLLLHQKLLPVQPPTPAAKQSEVSSLRYVLSRASRLSLSLLPFHFS